MFGGAQTENVFIIPTRVEQVDEDYCNVEYVSTCQQPLAACTAWIIPRYQLILMGVVHRRITRLSRLLIHAISLSSSWLTGSRPHYSGLLTLHQ